MKLKDAERILLTGAGFTHNIGAPLAKDMWAEIFNNKSIQTEPRVRSLMLNDFDYESVYYSVMEGNFTEDEKDAINEAVYNAYVNLDYIVRNWCFTADSPYPVNSHKVSELISRFSDNNFQGYFFTLNQDLFIERKYLGQQKCSSPGIRWEPEFMMHNMRDLELSEKEFCRLPDKDELKEKKEEILKTCKFLYIKLHGSYGWLSYDGSKKLVIGGRKEEQIQKEPLLTWYFEIFKNVLSQPEHHLLIIGYGFGDEHINKIIADAVEQSGLKIYIVSPKPVDELYDKKFIAMDSKIKDRIWSGLSGYFQCTLVQMFPPDQSVTQHYRSLLKCFFGINIR